MNEEGIKRHYICNKEQFVHFLPKISPLSHIFDLISDFLAFKQEVSEQVTYCLHGVLTML